MDKMYCFPSFCKKILDLEGMKNDFYDTFQLLRNQIDSEKIDPGSICKIDFKAIGMDKVIERLDESEEETENESKNDKFDLSEDQIKAKVSFLCKDNLFKVNFHAE